jgi:glutathione S-transferase
MIALYTYNISPYSAKVRAILRWKLLPFEERIVHPLRRGFLKAQSGSILVPMLVDGDGTVVTDSTAIARHVEEKYPARPILPSDPVLRARALLLEEWADEGLPRVVQPVRWFVGNNPKKVMAQFRSAYAPGLANDLIFKIVGSYMHRSNQKYRMAKPTDYLNRLSEVMRYLDGALAETGFLAGPAPSVADFAVYGFLSGLEGLDGWETIRAHRRVAKLLKSLTPEGKSDAPDAYDAGDEAVIDASRLRRAQPK